MQIRKVKWKDERVEIHTEEPIGATDDVKQVVLRCSQAPTPEFVRAICNLEPHVRTILELLPEQWDGAMSITGVSFSMSDDGVEGAVITGQVALAGSSQPFGFNTPHMPFEQYSETGRAPLMPEGAIVALRKVQEQAELYLGGDRAQQALFAAA